MMVASQAEENISYRFGNIYKINRIVGEPDSENVWQPMESSQLGPQPM